VVGFQERVRGLKAEEFSFFQHRVRDRREAGEHEDGLGWRALVDVRIQFGHWKRNRGTGQPIEASAIGELGNKTSRRLHLHGQARLAANPMGKSGAAAAR
jgi:hypothetical protein